MRWLVVGCGSIGDRHIGNLIGIKAGDVFACDLDKNRLNYVKTKYKIKVFNDIEKGFNQKPDVVFICTPPSSHISIALTAIKNNAHVFIEKPLSNSLDKVDKLIKTAEKKHLQVFVGYNFRFENGLQLVKSMINERKIGRIFYARAEFAQYLPDWRPWQDYRKSYTAIKKFGGGIILDGSHEIDYMRWFFGEADKVFCFADKISNLQVETEDLAEILIKFKKGTLCAIHLDFIRPGYSRKCEIVGEKGAIIWDFSENIVKLYTLEKKYWFVKRIAGTTNDMYVEEIKHFLNAIKTGEKLLIDGHDGKKTLELALAAKESAKSHALVKL